MFYLDDNNTLDRESFKISFTYVNSMFSYK